MVMATYAVVGGVEQGWQNSGLPAGFSGARPHQISVTKTGSMFTFFLDGIQQQQRWFSIENGQPGLVTEDTMANYSAFQVVP
jgi:hypothetical protein